MLYRCTKGAQQQVLLCADLENPSTLPRIRGLLPPAVRLVYSEPPWNPGNAKYWRTYAKQPKATTYDHFLDAWMGVVKECLARGASDILVEQSIITKHCQLFIDAAIRAGLTLPFQEKWKVFYGSPKRPNALLHFGRTKLSTDPAGMAGEEMTVRACEGLDIQPGSWFVDPCMGLGTTSRVADRFECNCFGSELNPKRLAVTVGWLKKQGYRVEESP